MLEKPDRRVTAIEERESLLNRTPTSDEDHARIQEERETWAIEHSNLKDYIFDFEEKRIELLKEQERLAAALTKETSEQVEP